MILNIDTNPAENAIRLFVVGRKNSLLSATAFRAKANTIYTAFFETAKANNIEPHNYLCQVFSEFSGARTIEKIEKLPP